MQKVHVLGETSAGKSIGFIVREGLMEVAFKEGGQVPESLKGRFSNIKMLKELVDQYILSSKPKKEVKKVAPKGK